MRRAVLQRKRVQKMAATQERQAYQPQAMSQSDLAFLSRMDDDTEGRRRTKAINEMKKHPAFRPSMLEPPKPKFKAASLEGGPIIKTHKQNKSGLEKKKPHDWCAARPRYRFANSLRPLVPRARRGPLGGWY